MTLDIDAVSGPAFPRLVKWLASALVAGTCVQALRVGTPLLGAGWTGTGALLFAGAVALVFACLWWIWRSRISVGASHVRQTWFWNKEVAWGDVVQARIIGWPALGWLVAPRLVVRVRGGGLVTFHIGDAAVLRALTSGLSRATRNPAY